MTLKFQKKQYAERQRRQSTLARSDAIQGMQYMPRKQNSSPLPEFPRIYERGHAHSRSWNPGYDDMETQLIEPLQFHYDRIAQREPMYREPQQQMFIPTINEPEIVEHHGGRHVFQKQAKSFDVSTNERRQPFDRRTNSLASRNYPVNENSISAACHSLWAAKGHLEQLHALGISDPSSASTSFDSNTDSHSTAPTEPVLRVEDADQRRSSYKSSSKDARWKRMSYRSSRLGKRGKGAVPKSKDESRERPGYHRSLTMDRAVKSHSSLWDPWRESRDTTGYQDWTAKRLDRALTSYTNLLKPRESRDRSPSWKPRRDESKTGCTKSLEWCLNSRSHPLEPRDGLRGIHQVWTSRPGSGNHQSLDRRLDWYSSQLEPRDESITGYTKSLERSQNSHSQPLVSRDGSRDRSMYPDWTSRHYQSLDRRLEIYSIPRNWEDESRDFYSFSHSLIQNSLMTSHSLDPSIRRPVMQRQRPTVPGRSYPEMVPHVPPPDPVQVSLNSLKSPRRRKRTPLPWGDRRISRNQESEWEMERRNRNLSLLIQRKGLSTAAVSSMDSNSIDSTGQDVLFASSMDSSGSDLEQRRLSLMNRHVNISTPHVGRMERDYSVDEKSDNLFREWSRVDPAYETHCSPRSLQRGFTQDSSSSHVRIRPAYKRQFSVSVPMPAPLL